MNLDTLTRNILKKGSFLCVGLDPDLEKIPDYILSTEDPLFEFCKMVINATAEHCVAFKPNTAFFEAFGSKGWASLERVINYIGKEHFVIADAKRGDIGNTAKMYAKAFFENLNVDAVTLSPYMGKDSVLPYLEFPGKWAIILVKTSNPGSNDLQVLNTGNNKPLYINVLEKSLSWGTINNTMMVVGANNLKEFDFIREIAPDHFMLVPGFGAQGGKLGDIKPYLSGKTVGILANYSRQIIYAGDEEQIKDQARAIHQEMKEMLTSSGFI